MSCLKTEWKPDFSFSRSEEKHLSLEERRSRVERYRSLFAISFSFADFSESKSISLSLAESFVSIS